jgi:hypothetical protein
MNIFDIVLVVIGFPIGVAVTLRLIRVNNAKKLAALIVLEESFPTGEPKECLKCGNSKSNPLGMTLSAPTFHSPRHMERDTALNRPEHLSYSCWNCSHKVKIKPGAA